MKTMNPVLNQFLASLHGTTNDVTSQFGLEVEALHQQADVASSDSFLENKKSILSDKNNKVFGEKSSALFLRDFHSQKVAGNQRHYNLAYDKFPEIQLLPSTSLLGTTEVEIITLKEDQTLSEFIATIPSSQPFEFYFGLSEDGASGQILNLNGRERSVPYNYDFKISRTSSGTLSIKFCNTQGSGHLWEDLNPNHLDVDNQDIKNMMKHNLIRMFFIDQDPQFPEDLSERWIDALIALAEIQNDFIDGRYFLFADVLKLALQNPNGSFDSSQHQGCQENLESFISRLADYFEIESFYLQFHRNGTMTAFPTDRFNPEPSDQPYICAKFEIVADETYRLQLRTLDNNWQTLSDSDYDSTYMNPEFSDSESMQRENPEQERIHLLLNRLFQDEKGSFAQKATSLNLLKELTENLNLIDDDEYENLIDEAEDDDPERSQTADQNQTAPVLNLDEANNLLQSLDHGTDLVSKWQKFVQIYINHTQNAFLLLATDSPEDKFATTLDSKINSFNKVFFDAHDSELTTIDSFGEGYGFNHIKTILNTISTFQILTQLEPVVHKTIGWPILARLDCFADTLSKTEIAALPQEIDSSILFDFAIKYSDVETLDAKAKNELNELLHQLGLVTKRQFRFNSKFVEFINLEN